MDAKKLARTLAENNQPSFRLKQILLAVFQNDIFDYQNISTLPQTLKQLLAAAVPIFCFKKITVVKSQDNLAHQALIELADNATLETILLQPQPGSWSICLSSQAKINQLDTALPNRRSSGLRNLTAEEITDQVLFWKKHLTEIAPNQTLHNIIYRGGGDPLANFEAVSQSINNLTDAELFGLSERKISVSTGLATPTILTLTNKFPQINLALALPMPVSGKNVKTGFKPASTNSNFKLNLIPVGRLLKKYFQTHRRKVFLEYFLIKDTTDTPNQISELISWIKRLEEPALLHLNLIQAHNPGAEISSKEKINHIKNQLLREHISVTIRKNLGQELTNNH